VAVVGRADFAVAAAAGAADETAAAADETALDAILVR